MKGEGSDLVAEDLRLPPPEFPLAPAAAALCHRV